jgi:acetyl-CoA carboxylase biotin carboxyl carrier protein
MTGPNANQDIFDVRRIRRLVELMKEHDLNEIDLREGETRIQLRRGGEPVLTVAPRPMAAAPVAAAPALPGPPSESAPAKTVESQADEKHVVIIKSPMVGTYYAAPNPESPPFVKVGDLVGPDSTVCVIEAMKHYNQAPAEVTGRITAVLVENGQPVEFGQPLFKVDTRG